MVLLVSFFSFLLLLLLLSLSLFLFVFFQHSLLPFITIFLIASSRNDHTCQPIKSCLSWDTEL